jgi:DnaJ family protein C protein 11
LSDELIPSSVFYATVTPVIVWAVVKKLIVDPIVHEQKKRDKEKQRELNKTRYILMLIRYSGNTSAVF